MSTLNAVTAMTIAAFLAGCGDNPASTEKTARAETADEPRCVDNTGVIVSDAWIRSSRTGQPTSAAYLTLTNCSDQDDALIAAAFAGAGATELHATAMSTDGVASMTQEKTIAIAAGDTISLEPGGGHIMLVGLADAVAIGADPVLTLKFENAEALNVTFEVRDAMSGDDHSAH